MIRHVAQCRLALRVEPASHAREVSVPGCVRQIVGQRPDAQQQWKQLRLCIRERELEGLRRGRRLPPQYRGIEVEQGRDEFPAIVQRGHFDQAHLKCHTRIRQRPCFVSQSIDKGCKVAVVQRASDPFHDETPPQSGLGNVDEVGLVADEMPDKCGASRAAIDVAS
jgi:hypothetical protein